ncbi:MAG: hypothetical protein LWW85_13710, partial [Marinilabiliales bacterium]|nr:hypothetical protein [Marinilabiliales bacterium]
MIGRVSMVAIFLFLLSSHWLPCRGQQPSIAISKQTAQPLPLITSDGWSATDALGREVPVSGPARTKRAGKQVALFYWTWHTDAMVRYGSVGNVSEILRNHPEALKDTHHPAWDRGGGNNHFWEEPLLGYYRSTDPWVFRKHAEMLADAGVDGVFLDCTNKPALWKSAYEVLFKVWADARKDGVNAPSIAFILPFGPSEDAAGMIRNLYQDLYQPERYPEMWFRWHGKPIIMAYEQSLHPESSETDRKILDFFTFRPGQPDYVRGPNKKYNQWGWLEIFPQHKFMERPDGSCEEVTVGVAQNAGPLTNGHCSAFNLPGTYGRSFTFAKGQDHRADGYLYGLNFQEQWNRALLLDPDLVFVTGWNEYIAGKWEKGSGWTGEPFSFVDEFDWEHSRDIEPNKGWGDKGDVYYYQLVQNIRRFKGLQAADSVSPPQSFKIGQFKGWELVKPEFRHYRGNTFHRDHPGHANQYYTNHTGRNDLVLSKVAQDESYVYFYVQTAGPIVLPTKKDRWMYLLIDVDRNHQTGWEGYDFLINYQTPQHGKGKVGKCVENKWEWSLQG